MPHDALPASLQMPAGSALFVGTFVHVPGVPGSAHDWHEPLQPELQQTPCAQNDDWHSDPIEHEAPSVFLPQLLSLHTRGAMQEVLSVQALKHAEPLQT